MAFGPPGRRAHATARAAACAAALLPAFAAAQSLEIDIRRLTLEELLDLDVYSVSRKLESVRGAPAAVYGSRRRTSGARAPRTCPKRGGSCRASRSRASTPTSTPSASGA